MDKDYYGILGVKKDATTDEIVAAYKKLAMKYHPDRQQGKSDAEKKAAEEKFKECSEAAEVLRDPDKRAKYDRFGSGDFQGGFDFGGGGFDPMEFFRKMHGGMGGFDPFEDFGFGGGGRSPRGGMAPDAYDPEAPEDGVSLETELRVSFKESVLGCSKELVADLGEQCAECGGTGCRKGSKPEPCPDCGGTGQLSRVTRTGMMVHRVITPCPRCRGTGVSADPCPACGGSKRAKKERRISVKIPAGAPDGVRLRLAGCGQCGVKGGRPGDMYVSVRVEPSPIFDRDGNDIYFTAYVSPAVMALGGSAKIPTLYGYKEIKIEPGTRAGAKLRVAGYGIRTPRGAGSMVIAVVPDIPAKLSAEQRKAWEKVAEAGGSGPGAEAAAKAAEEFYS